MLIDKKGIVFQHNFKFDCNEYDKDELKYMAINIWERMSDEMTKPLQNVALRHTNYVFKLSLQIRPE